MSDFNKNSAGKHGPSKKEHVKPISSSKVTRSLERETSHGFQEFDTLEDLNEFFTTDPDLKMGSVFEPPLFKKMKTPTVQDMARSEGKRA
jgi:hypothetical protein